jgi:hypothetical protein
MTYVPCIIAVVGFGATFCFKPRNRKERDGS